MRTRERCDDEPTSRVKKEIFEVARLFPQESRQQCTAEETVVREGNVIPQERLSERILEQIPPPEIVEEFVVSEAPERLSTAFLSSAPWR